MEEIIMIDINNLTEDQNAFVEKQTLLANAHNYLKSTDFKMMVDYDEDTTQVKIDRAKAREFIRLNS
jgi:hypothetical protein